MKIIRIVKLIEQIVINSNNENNDLINENNENNNLIVIKSFSSFY